MKPVTYVSMRLDVDTDIWLQLTARKWGHVGNSALFVTSMSNAVHFKFMRDFADLAGNEYVSKFQRDFPVSLFPCFLFL